MPGGPRSNIPIPDPSLLTTDALNREITTLKELITSQIALTSEKFRGVDVRLTDGKIAVDKAFDASEKAIAKTEAAFTKQIESCDSKINDVKERITILESRSLGARDGIGAIGAAVMGAVAAGALFVSVATLVYNIFHH
jgi:hypothetical protein